MFLQAKPAPRVGQAGNTRNVVGRKECFSVLTTRRIDLDRCQGHRALWSCAISTGNAQRNGVVTRNNYTKPAMWYRGTRVKAPGEAACNVSMDMPACPAPPAISKPDEYFEAAGMEFVWGTDDIDIKQLNNLFHLVNFPRRDENKLRTALEKTHTTLWIRSTKQSRWASKGQLLGFARATSDSNLTATIWDVSVHPAWQRQGAGRGLVERLVASLCCKGVPLICLYAEPHVVLLYERLGFQKDMKRMKGMGFATRSPAGQQMIAAAVQLQ